MTAEIRTPPGGVESAIQAEVRQGSWPVALRHRTWGSLGLTGVALSAGVAAWSYSIGGYVAYYLNAGMGTIAMIAGSLVGMFFVVMATVSPSVKYGIETISSSRPQFGSRGAWFSIFLQYASIIGWNCLLLILFGRAVAQVLVAGHIAGPGSEHIISVICSLAAIGFSWYSLRGGASAVRNFSFVIAILVAVIAAWMMYKLLAGVGVSTVFHAKALSPYRDRLLNYSTGFEILVASVLSWWPYMGGIVRMVPRARQTLMPTMLGMGLPTGVISLIGLYSALATGNDDPTTWFIKVGGLWFGILALVFLALANIGTAIVGAYATGIGIRQISFFEKKLSWNQTTLVVLLPVALISAFLPNQFMNSIPNFLAFLGVVFAPVMGIQIVDYYFLRGQRLNVRGIFNESSTSPYYFWGGINIAAIIAVVVGFITYVLLLNPVTYAAAPIFKFTTASIPSVILSGLAYYLATKWIVIPSGKGGYQQPEGVQQ